MKKKVLIVDGMGLIFRAYYSLIRRPLLTSRGKNTSAIAGFFKMINRLIKDHKPHAMVMTFDVSRHTFRSEIYPEYKAHRPETPEELREQIPEIKEIIEKMNMPFYYLEGYEADDIIGTLAELWKNQYDVRIVTGDKDLFQLVTDSVGVLGLVKGVTEVRDLDRDGVKELKGVYPEQIPDYLAIVGDASDNIPGVRGIGDKGAVKLLSEYKDLDEIYAGGRYGLGVLYFMIGFSILYLLVDNISGVILPVYYTIGMTIRLLLGNFQPDSIFADPVVTSRFMIVLILAGLFGILASISMHTIVRHISRLAFKDTVTDLPNRNKLQEILNHKMGRYQVFIDLISL